MPRTPLRLAGPALLTNSAATLYTVPTATKTIVRFIHVANTDSAPHQLTLSIGADAAATELFTSFSIPANSTYDHSCYYVLETTEIIQGFADTASKLNVTIDGDECTLG